MTEFTHSEVLFSDDDGLPIQFNIQNTTNKEHLRVLIEHGGGLCTLSDEAIILVSPGTKVLSVPPNKNLTSSRYILDCVKENCLLDTDEYKIEITEMEASDFSDNSASLQANELPPQNENRKSSNEMIGNSIDILEPVKQLSSQSIQCPDSNHDFDFKDTDNHIPIRERIKTSGQETSHLEFPLQSLENHIQFGACIEKDNLNSSVNTISDSLDFLKPSTSIDQRKTVNEQFSIVEHPVSIGENPVVEAVVSSSQESPLALDEFDCNILNKVQQKTVMEEEDSLSRSYTVSSSADAQQSSNKDPLHTSGEIFGGSSAAPDSPSQSTERQRYINDLEKEIEQILKKPSPKSIQDKITLVKYICIVKKLAPAIVLQTLQKF